MVLTPLSISQRRSPPSRGTGKTDLARPRRCCCLACRIWNRERTRYGLEIPARQPDPHPQSVHKQVPALKDFLKEDRPYPPAVFWSFRIMAGMGVLMIALGSAAPGCAIGGDCITRVPSVVCVSAWACRPYCPGRRVGDYRDGPPAVGDLRLAAHPDAVSLHSTLQMAISLLVFIVVYCAVFGVGYYYIFRLD